MEIEWSFWLTKESFRIFLLNKAVKREFHSVEKLKLNSHTKKIDFTKIFGNFHGNDFIPNLTPLFDFIRFCKEVNTINRMSTQETNTYWGPYQGFCWNLGGLTNSWVGLTALNIFVLGSTQWAGQTRLIFSTTHKI